MTPRIPIEKYEAMIGVQMEIPDSVQLQETSYGYLRLVFRKGDAILMALSLGDDVLGALARAFESFLQDKQTAKETAERVAARMGAGQGSSAVASENGAAVRPSESEAGVVSPHVPMNRRPNL